MKREKMRKNLILFLSIPFWISCQQVKAPEEPIRPNHIVFIFDTLYQDCNTLKFSGAGETTVFGPLLSFRGKGTKPSPLMEIEKDTLTMEIFDDSLLIVDYRNNPLHTISFLVKKGDTLLVRNQKVTPFITLKNREVLPYDLNYPYYRAQRYGMEGGFPLREFVVSPFFIGRFLDKYTYEEVFQKYQDELNDEALWLDSLYRENLLSEEAYKMYEWYNRYERVDMKVHDKTTPLDTIRAMLYAYDDSIFRHDYYSSYRYAYCRAADEYYIYRRQPQPTPQRPYDLEEAYLLMTADTLLRGELRDMLSVQWRVKLVEQKPYETAKKYYDELCSIPDSNFVSIIRDRYGRRFDETLRSSNQLELKAPDGTRFTFEKFLEQHRGKVVYVDFWASWCIPCLEGMPSSVRLREGYSGKDVVFVYLSMDATDSDWKGSWEKALLTDYEHNYLILNASSSSLVKENKVRYIPRFFLFGKDGKLIHDNAPAPETDEIRKLIDEAL